MKCILHGESAMRDYLNGDIDSGCGSLSREDPMFLGIPRQVVPPLIICDSSVRDAQMTRYFARKKLEESALTKKAALDIVVKDIWNQIDYMGDASTIF